MNGDRRPIHPSEIMLAFSIAVTAYLIGDIDLTSAGWWQFWTIASWVFGPLVACAIVASHARNRFAWVLTVFAVSLILTFLYIVNSGAL